MEPSLIVTIVGWLFAPICSALIVALVEQRKRTKEAKADANKHNTDIEKARIIIEKASARAHIKAAYRRFIIDQEHMTIASYEELAEEYEAYRALGGNGTAKAYMEEIMALKPYLVTE